MLTSEQLMERKDEAFGREMETSLYNCEITSSIHSTFGRPFTRERDGPGVHAHCGLRRMVL